VFAGICLLHDLPRASSYVGRGEMGARSRCCR
jgi:hypothetical protein